MHKEQELLALHGGQAVRGTMLPYGRQEIDSEDIRVVQEVLRSDWITTGPKVAEFEETFAEYVGACHAVSFSSGTAALHGAVFAAGLGPGDEAVTTPLTFCATANSLLYQGARPVLADVCADTLNIDPDHIARQISSRTKALLPVAYAGHPADYQGIAELAERHGLIIIEDACHALGAEYKGSRVGGLGHLTVFSFHPVKHITTGEGGMVATNVEEYAQRLRRFRNHGIDRDFRERQEQGQWDYDMVELGYNYRLTDMGCALGLSQLGRIEGNLRRRREIVVRYDRAFEEMPGTVLLRERPEVVSARHLYPLRCDPGAFRVSRTEIFAALRAENIGVNVHYIPLHYHTYYRNRFGYKGGEFPVAEAAYDSLVSLPLFPSMTDRDVSDVIEAVGKVLHHYLV